MRTIAAFVLALCLAASAVGCQPQGGADGGAPSAEPTGTAEGTSTAPPAGWGDESTWILPAHAVPDTSTLTGDVTNPWWPLNRGASWSYEASTTEGTETIEVVVEDGTRMVMGVPCAVVRDTVKLNGELIEDTRDWYAQDRSGTVWYMGEAVDNYENGKVVDHEGSWEAGVDDALPGIKVWSAPQIGKQPYYQEFKEGVAEDLARDVSADGSATVPAGAFGALLVTEEWSPLEPTVIERKYYAKGVGTVREERVRGGEEVTVLTRYQGQ